MNQLSQITGYARVSTKDQSLDAQIYQLEKAGCQRIYSDRLSGKTERSSTELGRMLDQLRTGDVVVVTKIDRLSRSLIDLLKIVETIESKGAYLKSLGEPLDTSQPLGRSMVQVIGIIAEFERNRIRERTLEGLQAAREQGRIGGRPRILNQRQIALVVRMHADGDSLREIARTMNVSTGTIKRALERHKSETSTST